MISISGAVKSGMSLTVNLYYKGQNGSARKFVEEMESSGIADAIRVEEGNEKYDLYMSVERYIRTEDLSSDDKFIRK